VALVDDMAAQQRAVPVQRGGFDPEGGPHELPA
jgi:hypothetical protein